MNKMRACSLLIMLLLLLFTFGCTREINPIPGEMTDARDGQTYQTVTLGDQTWLAQNLTTRPITVGVMRMTPQIAKRMEGYATGKQH